MLFFRKYTFFIITFCTLCSPFLANANEGMHWANMQQDVMSLSQQVGKMRLELEAIQQESETLRQMIAALQKEQELVFERKLSPLKEDMIALNLKQKQEIISLVAIQVERLAKQTQVALDALSKTLPKGGANGAMTQFSDDYPKNGVVYTVQSGDTLGDIAKKHSAKVKDIQNANRIANPSRDLRAGDSIFIPQKT